MESNSFGRCLSGTPFWVSCKIYKWTQQNYLLDGKKRPCCSGIVRNSVNICHLIYRYFIAMFLSHWLRYAHRCQCLLLGLRPYLITVESAACKTDRRGGHRGVMLPLKQKHLWFNVKQLMTPRKSFSVFCVYVRSKLNILFAMLCDRNGRFHTY